jgi:nucleotide-binding universal stress UspA family protein
MVNETKKIVVGLDLTDMDPTLIRYTAFLTSFMQVTQLYFVHIYQDNDLPEEMLEALLPDKSSHEAALRQEIENSVKAHAPQMAPPVEFIVKNGPLLPEIIQLLKEIDADLIVLGRKNTKGSGTFLTRIARRSRCSVLIIPDKRQPALENVLLCNDFSLRASEALQMVLAMGLHKDLTVYSQHIYYVPTGYHKSGKSFEEFSRIMKKHAVKRFHELVDPLDKGETEVIPIYTLDKKGDAAMLVNLAAESIQADLVVVGSKGRTFAAAIFLGSFAEMLIREEIETPLLVFKQKDEVLGVMDAIQQL